MTKEKLKKCKKSFSMLEVLIAVTIFVAFSTTISIATRNKSNKLFLDECEKIRNFVAEAIEIASTNRTSFSIAVNVVSESGHDAKALIIGYKNGSLTKYEYLYLKHTQMNSQVKCTFDGASFTMTPSVTWRIWKPSNSAIMRTLTISGNGFCTLK